MAQTLDLQTYQPKRNPALILFSMIYVFVNGVFLPSGLFYSTLFTPFLLVWILSENVSIFTILLGFLLPFSALFLVQAAYGISVKEYAVSTALIFSCVIFCIAAYLYFSRYYPGFENLLEKILYLNFFLVFLALLAFIFFDDDKIFWYKNEITETLQFPRLKLFTSEASEYSLLLVTPCLFYLQYLIAGNVTKKGLLIFVGILACLCLSLSFSAIGGILTAITLFSFVKLRSHPRMIGAIVLVIAVLIGLLLVSQDSGVVMRLFSIFSGNDTSANGRTFEAYQLSIKVLDQRNPLFGIGPGQLKIIGANTFDSFYNYMVNPETGEIPTVRLPCAVADTLVTFGYVGLAARFILEIYFFFKCKVFESDFRLMLFLFAFVYQFFGSNLTDTQEYLIWIIAFCPGFSNEYFKAKKING